MVISIDDFLEPEDLVKYQNYVLCSGLSQKIKEDQELTAEFWNKYGDKLKQNFNDVYFSGLYPYVTITNSSNPVFKHIDSKFKNEKFKILIYLNNVHNGGTVFFKEKTVIPIMNKENRLVLFDINIPHESEKFSKDDKKIAIGFRLKS
jgi:hypothetical protein